MVGRHTKALARTAGAALLLTVSAAASAQGASFTAQEPPRVTVFDFEDANTEAAKAGYGSSVESMLVSFFKERSQLAVVERKSLGRMFEEKVRIQRGMVDVRPDDKTSLELLKKIDVYVMGAVTLLNGSRVEIDAKLFSSFSGEIVATAQRSGPESCLRSIVDRLGAALEQEILRSYSGNLEIHLTSPENVRLFLTPLSLDAAAREVPAERNSTVNIGDEYDTVEPWITNPTSYTIKNLLPGWYSLRLARSGYKDLEAPPHRWEVRQRAGQLEVVDPTTGFSLDEVDAELRRFVVRVDPRTTLKIDGDALGFVLRRKSGSLAPRVKRKSHDKDYSRKPQRAVLLGGHGLEINPSIKPVESREDQKCNLVRELPPPLIPYSRTHVLEGQKFDFTAFQGGELIIDDYQGEVVPAGRYEMVLWDPYFDKQKIEVIVRDGDQQREARASLPRDTLPLKLEATGTRPGHRVSFKGRETSHFLPLPLDFTGTKERRGLPADIYKVSTDIPGLDGWTRTYAHLPGTAIAPQYFTSSPAYKPETTGTNDDKPARPNILIVKTRFVLAGRLDLLHRIPDQRTADLFIDEQVGELLDRLLHDAKVPPESAADLSGLLRRLEVIDLLLLNPRDMARLREFPEVAALVQDYIKKGGALFAFVTEPGEYGGIVEAPLTVGPLSKLTARFDLTPGQVAGIVPRFDRKVDLPVKRALPEVVEPPASWRVVAFTEVLETPRILERGEKKEGGYVALWLDDPAKFRNQQGKTVPKVEETRAKVEERILKWARYLMYRRYDKTGKLRRKAEEGLGW
jgi:TolB-like protein